MDLSSSLFKRDFVHPEFHEEYAAPVLCFEIFGSQRVGNCIRVKSLSLILNDDGDSFSCFTATTKLNQLGRVETVAVNCCILQSLPDCQLDVEFVAGHAARFF